MKRARTTLPAGALRAGLGSVARGDSAEAAAARLALLARAGVFTDNASTALEGGGGGMDDTTAAAAAAVADEQRMLQFELRLGCPPKVLAGIAGIMCCTPEETIAIASALSDDDAGDAGDAGDAAAAAADGSSSSSSSSSPDVAPIAFVDIEGRVTVRLAEESRRRAGRYVAYILDQVEPMVCGGGDDRSSADADAETDVLEGVDEETWEAACRLQSGARGVFRAVETQLDDTSLLTRGEWIDAAVADLLVAY